jgi:hypothetical protein
MKRTTGSLLLITALAAAHPSLVAEEGEKGAAGEADGASEDVVDIERQLYVGKVVKLPDLLARKGIRFTPEMQEHVVLEMEDGTVLPILADWRGRAFFQDERLRNRPVTLVAKHRPDVGYLQALMVFTHDDQGRPLFTDYWCDVCSIPMYELKPCECCQGEIRLRMEPQELPEGVAPAAR